MYGIACSDGWTDQGFDHGSRFAELGPDRSVTRYKARYRAIEMNST